MSRNTSITVCLVVLLAGAIVRLWLLPLRSSFWVDEMETAFLVHHGSDPSLDAAPQVRTIYTIFPMAMEKIFGFSEAAYRIPSVLMMGAALLLLALLARRLIHPDAGWFVVFAALTLRLINYEAGNARPYAMGIFVATAALWFLVRWLDSARWLDGLLFVAAAALLWRVHLVYWPLYIVFAAYTVVRLLRQETPVSWTHAGLTYAALAVALVPVLLRAITLLPQAGAHVIVDHRPTVSELVRTLKFTLVLGCGAGAWVLSRLFHWRRQPLLSVSAVTLILGWWLVHPLSLFAFSWITGNSAFVDRYLSLSMPGAAFAATLAIACFLPPGYWKVAAAALGTGVFLFMGNLRDLSPSHHNSDWREASIQFNRLGLGGATPVIFPSPFIEAKPPVWRPDYPLPGFLYCHLLTYPVDGKPYLFPFDESPEAEQYASALAPGPLSAAGRFAIYGDGVKVRMWQTWFAGRSEFAGWQSRRLGPFGDVDVVVFERSAR